VTADSGFAKVQERRSARDGDYEDPDEEDEEIIHQEVHSLRLHLFEFSAV
jgi:hypothetical protein